MTEIRNTKVIFKGGTWWLIVVFLFFSLVILVVGKSYYNSQRTRIIEETQNSLGAIASLKIDQIENWYRERKGDASLIKYNLPLISRINDYLYNSGPDDRAADIEKWMETVCKGFDYRNVLIIDTALSVRLSNDKADSVSGSYIQDELREVLRKNELRITEIHSSETHGFAHMDVLVPLADFSKTGNRRVGLVILRIDPSITLFPLIQSWPTPSRSSETLIIRRDGDSVIFINELRHLKNTSMNLRIHLSEAELLASQVITGKRGFSEGVDYRGIPVVGYLEEIPSLNWFMVAKVDRSEVYFPLKRLIFITIILTVLLILLNVSAFTFWFRKEKISSFKKQLEAERAIRESEERFGIAFKKSPITITISSIINGRYLDVNDAFIRDTGFTREEVIGRSAGDLGLFESDSEREELFAEAKEKGEVFGKVCRFRSKSGRLLYGLVSVSTILLNDQPCLLSSVIDITRQAEADEEDALNLKRLESLVKILQHQAETVQQLLDYALDEAIKLTGSKIGYIYFYDEEKKEFILNSWSKEVMKECSITDPQTCYELDKTGIWGEAVRQKKPVLINDFRKDNPLKKGYPEGHAPLLKYLTIPVFSGEKIVAVVGVANKESDYLQQDVLQLTILMDSVWKVLSKREAEKSFLISERKYQRTFENASIGISLTRPDGVLSNVNSTFCNMTGYSKEELSEMGFTTITHPDDLAESRECVRSLIAGERKYYRLEKRYIKKDGNVMWADVSTTLLRDENGEPYHFVTHIIDITAKKLLEEERFRLIDIIEKSLNEIYIFDAETLLFDYVNPAALRNIGYTYDEIRLLTPVDIKPEFTGDQFRSFIDPLGNNEVARLTFETVHKRKDGSEYFVEVHLQLIVQEDKKLYYAIMNDISERKAAQSALLESEEKYRKLVEISTEGIFINQNDKITYINKAALILLGAETPEQITGKSPFEIFHPDYHGTIKQRIADMIETGASVPTIEEKIIRLDGTTVDVEVAAIPFIFKGDRAIQVLLRDITERKISEAAILKLNEELEERVLQRTSQLEAANKELEAFSYSVSHDLRAPLRSVHSFTNILVEEYQEKLDNEGKRICGIISGSAVQMGELIDDLLNFSRIGRSSVSPVLFDMESLVRSVIDELAGDEVNRTVFKVGSILNANADHTLLKLVWTNLISNAIKYTSKNPKPEILIGSRQDGDMITYFIKDNGVGFDMHYVHKLFGVFQRLHSSSEFEGNGVGLAIVQRIILRHNGKVWAEGETGKGSSFYFSLPVCNNN